MLKCVSGKDSHQEEIYDDVGRSFRLYFRDGTEMRFGFSYRNGDLDTEELINDFLIDQLGIEEFF